MQQAALFERLEGGHVVCQLCAHYCRLEPGEVGVCRVRHNVDGTLVTSSFGRPVLLAVEPIEKKHLFHVLPGSRTLSLGTAGCNLSCRFCINWRVSQRGVAHDEPEVTPEEVVRLALHRRVQCLAFTYTEPTVYFEYALAIAQLARRAGLAVVAHSNGFMSPDALRQLGPSLDALSVDLKSWQDAALRQFTGGSLEPVLENLRLARQCGIWIEVSTLVVPGLSNEGSDLGDIAQFIAMELGRDTPWHVLRFFPSYKMLGQPVTSPEQLRQAVRQGRRAGLRYIYTKDLSREMLRTRCPACQTILIERDGLGLASQRLENGRCCQCGEAVAGVGLGRPVTALNFASAEDVL